MLAMVYILRYQIARHFHYSTRAKERLDMQAPASLNIIGCLPSIDAVIAEEIVGQVAYSDAFMRGTDKGVCADLGKTFAKDAGRYALVFRARRFTKRSSIAVIFDPPDCT